MRSEIPQLQVITGIADAEIEDFVAQLLYSQGWSIVHRAIDVNSLATCLTERGGVLRTVIIYRSDLPQWSEDLLPQLGSAMITFISLDGVEINSHSIMSHIRGQLRLPMIHHSELEASVAPTSRPSNVVKNQHKIVTITGTSGSPGRSYLALALADYISWQRKVQLVDADLRSPSLAYLKGANSRGGNVDQASRFQLITLDSSTKPTELNLGEPSSPKVSLIDIGALGPLEEVVNDRRWQASLTHNILETSTTLIYVTRSSGLGLLRLERFIHEFPVLLRKIPIIYVLSQGGTTRQDRAIVSRFNALTHGEERCLFPFDTRPILANDNQAKPTFFDFGRTTSKAGKEIGRIAELIM